MKTNRLLLAALVVVSVALFCAAGLALGQDPQPPVIEPPAMQVPAPQCVGPQCAAPAQPPWNQLARQQPLVVCDRFGRPYMAPGRGKEERYRRALLPWNHLLWRREWGPAGG